MQLEQLYLNFITGLVSAFIDPDTLVGNVLIGEYGVLTMTTTFLIGLLLPLVAGFYFMQHVLVDSCLFPRIARLLDKPLHLLGLGGNSIIPISLGFGCVTVALVATDILASRRERVIASVLLSIAVPCSAQTVIIIAMALMLDFKYSLIFFAVVISVFLMLGFLMNLLFPGKYVAVPITTPPLRMPPFLDILKKTVVEAKNFLKDAGPAFFVGSVVISVMEHYNIFMLLRNWFAPMTVGFLHLPEDATNLFIMSIVKRDLGAAAFFSMIDTCEFTQPQIVVTLTVLTLFVPCFASQMILFKNHHPVTAILIWLVSFVLSFSIGGLVSWFIN